MNAVIAVVFPLTGLERNRHASDGGQLSLLGLPYWPWILLKLSGLVVVGLPHWPVFLQWIDIGSVGFDGSFYILKGLTSGCSRIRTWLLASLNPSPTETGQTSRMAKGTLFRGG